MEFIDNLKNFFTHIYRDFMNYINNFLDNPNSSGIIFAIFIVACIGIFIFEKPK